MASSFNWDDFYVAGQTGEDEHWVEGQPVGSTDLEPVKLVPHGPTPAWPAGNTPVAHATPTSDGGKKA
jgi:hypothetical protein